jgi:hypothetical protein
VKTTLPSLLFVGCLLALFVWTGSSLVTSDGPCGRYWVTGAFSCHVEGRLAPPSRHYVVKAHDGTVLASGSVPKPVDYLWMVVAFAIPFVVWGIGLSVRRALERQHPH